MFMEIINLENPIQLDRFDQLLLKDPYSFLQQNSQWAKAVSKLAEDEVKFFLSETAHYSVTASMYLFRCVYGGFMISNVQAGSLGCFSFVGDPEKRAEAYRNIIDEIILYATEQKCIGITVTSNPYSNDHGFIEQFLQPEAGMKTFISYIDIEHYFDDSGRVLFKDYNVRSNLSRNIKKAYQHEFKFDAEHSLETLEEWYRNIHCRRIQELGGQPLTWDLFKNIFTAPGLRSNIVFFTVRKNSKLVSGDLCIYNEVGNLDNFMLSTDSDYLEQGVNYYMVDNILKWCHQHGMKRYNWQSSNPPQGGIFKFKKSWGSIVKDYYYFSKITDMNAFKNMIQTNPFQEIMKNTQGHFIAPYHTVRAGAMGVLSKEEINNIAEIYKS
jgi:hypothetical protein